jgi:hypothetical protein
MLVRDRRPDEGRDELWAREIVETILGVPVKRFDDGTAPRQVDALVGYPDRVAALEIVTDPDEPFQSLQAELDRENPIKVPALRESWVVVLLSRESWIVVLSPEAKIKKIKAEIKKIKQELPALLLAFQDNPSLKREPLGYRTFELHRLGILSAKPIDNSTAPGRVWLTVEAWGRGHRRRAQCWRMGDKSLSREGSRCADEARRTPSPHSTTHRAPAPFMTG